MFSLSPLASNRLPGEFGLFGPIETLERRSAMLSLGLRQDGLFHSDGSTQTP